MPRQRFTSTPTYEYEDGEEIVFELETTDIEGEQVVEEFKCLPEIAQGSLDDLERAAITTVDGNRQYHHASIIKFLNDAIVPDERRRFDALMHDATRLVDGEALGKTMMWLVEVYTGFPMLAVFNSEHGHGSDNGGSEPNSVTEESSTPEPSPSATT